MVFKASHKQKVLENILLYNIIYFFNIHIYYKFILILKYHCPLCLFQLFTSYFSRPIKFMFHGSVGFNFTVRALGQRFVLTFHTNDVIGKAKLGGKKTSLHFIVVFVVVVVVLVVFVVVAVIAAAFVVAVVVVVVVVVVIVVFVVVWKSVMQIMISFQSLPLSVFALTWFDCA